MCLNLLHAFGALSILDLIVLCVLTILTRRLRHFKAELEMPHGQARLRVAAEQGGQP